MSQLYPKVASLFIAAGFELVRNGKGSHRIFRKADKIAVISTNICLRHDANRKLKKAGIDLKL